jgi:SAM-dependent methyltransferase
MTLARSPRRVEAEWLDELPPEDRRARASRADLRRVNRWMGQGAILQRLLLDVCKRQPLRLLELGCGDGHFMLHLARRLARRWPGVELILVDRQDIVDQATRQAFADLGWRIEIVTADVFDALSAIAPVDVTTANLFLHHFEQPRLADLLAKVAQVTGAFVACEPRRSRVALAGSGLLWAIGCNDVSRHDARISVCAGFNGGELGALWPEPERWIRNEGPYGLFTHGFSARREVAGEP